MTVERDLRVCFFGDSYVAGIGDSTALGWTGRVTAAALARGLPLTSYNLGVRRDTSILVGRRIASEGAPRLRPATDPRVILSFGVNDTDLEDAAPRATTAQTLAAFQSMQDALVAPLLLVGPPAVTDEAHNERLHALDVELEAAAERAHVPYVTTFTSTSENEIWREEVRRGDHFHPDAGGYAALAGLVQGPILEWLGTEIRR